jgi:hypothetical protein
MYICTYILERPGANPTTSEFTTTAPALQQASAFFKVEEIIVAFETHYIGGVVNFYSAEVVNFYCAGVTTHDSGIGSGS